MSRIVEQLKARALEIKKELMALYCAYRHPKVPWYAKVFTIIVVGYALSPIDLIPDFIPVLGYLDDLILIPAGIALALRMIPREVMEECRAKAFDMDRKSLGKSWGAAAVILVLWVVLFLAVLQAFI